PSVRAWPRIRLICSLASTAEAPSTVPALVPAIAFDLPRPLPFGFGSWANSRPESRLAEIRPSDAASRKRRRPIMQCPSRLRVVRGKTSKARLHQCYPRFSVDATRRTSGFPDPRPLARVGEGRLWCGGHDSHPDPEV